MNKYYISKIKITGIKRNIFTSISTGHKTKIFLNNYGGCFWFDGNLPTNFNAGDTVDITYEFDEENGLRQKWIVDIKHHYIINQSEICQCILI